MISLKIDGIGYRTHVDDIAALPQISET